MALKFFELVEHFMMDTFLKKLTQFEKTGSKGKTSNSLGNLLIPLSFSEVLYNFRGLYIFAIRQWNLPCLPFNKGNALNLKRNHKSNRAKLKFSVNKFFKTFYEKKAARPTFISLKHRNLSKILVTRLLVTSKNNLIYKIQNAEK